MKLLPVFFLLLLQIALLAETKLPSGAFWGEQLDGAMTAAAKAQKPLILVFGLVSEGDKAKPVDIESIKAGAPLGVPVMVTELTTLPPPVLTAVFDHVKGGGFRGATVICSPEGDKIWKVILTEATPAGQRKRMETAINEVRKEVTEWSSARPARGPQLPGDTQLYWGLQGKPNPTGPGVFGKVANQGVYFKDSDLSGPPDILLDDLTAAGVRYVNYISGQGGGAAPAAAAKMEKWTNVQGKVIEAAFVSLKDEKVTLRTAAGKSYTLPLASLAEESRTRAAELAATAK